MKNYILRSGIGSGFGGRGTLEYCFIASINNVNAMLGLHCGSYVFFSLPRMTLNQWNLLRNPKSMW